MTPTHPVGPAVPELLMVMLNERMDPELVPGGAIVGGANDPEQQSGVVAIMQAGHTKEVLSTSMVWDREQCRCVAPTQAEADAIGQHVFELAFNDMKGVVQQPSNGRSYMVYGTFVSGAPGAHWDSAETRESLLFVTVKVGMTPVP